MTTDGMDSRRTVHANGHLYGGGQRANVRKEENAVCLKSKWMIHKAYLDPPPHGKNCSAVKEWNVLSNARQLEQFQLIMGPSQLEIVPLQRVIDHWT